MEPGATAFAVIAWGAHSTARARTKASSAASAAAQAGNTGTCARNTCATEDDTAATAAAAPRAQVRRRNPVEVQKGQRGRVAAAREGGGVRLFHRGAVGETGIGDQRVEPAECPRGLRIQPFRRARLGQAREQGARRAPPRARRLRGRGACG